MKKQNLVFIAVALASLPGCWQSDYAFEGKYFYAVGEECKLPSSAADREHYVLEITKEVRNGTASYSAKFPVAAQMGLPITSSLGATATDDKELTFRFHKPEASGMFTGSPALDLVLTVIPNKRFDNHLSMTKGWFIAAQSGKVVERDILKGLRSSNDIGLSGACLRKEASTH